MNTRWFKPEEILLLDVWLKVNRHTHAYNDDAFWDKAVDMFNAHTVGDKRSKNMVCGKWTRINLDCQQFNSIYNNLKRTSGENDVDCLKNAKTVYERRSFGRRSFKYVHVWEFMRNNPIWLTYC